MNTQQKDWEKKWQERFGFLFKKIHLNTEELPQNNLTQFSILLDTEMKKFISTLLQQARKEAIEEMFEEIIEDVERIKLDMDVVVCDCGEPYKGTDPSDLINELFFKLKKPDWKV